MTAPLPAPAAGRTLAPGRVHVWTVRIDEQRSREDLLYGVLDRGERARAARFYQAADRERFVVAHGTVRLVLARYAAAGPRDLRFDTGPFGKPFLAHAGQAAGLEFNLAHSGDLVVLAVALGRAVGVDVERWSEFDYDEVAAVAFSEPERRGLAGLRPEEKAAGFFAGWTRKEAYIKATGFGVSQGLDSFDVSLEPGAARLIADRRLPDAARWSMRDLAVPAGYSAALAADGRDWDLVSMPLPPGGWEAF